jgi:pimeloyl-ACP methyl ester carboxylesterase
MSQGLAALVALSVIPVISLAADASPIRPAALSRAVSPAVPRVPRFEATACPTKPIPTTLPANAHCGFLVVPENRAKPNGRTIRLAVGIVPAVSKTPKPDPIVYLAGGPGGYPLGEAKSLIDAGFNRDRNLILLSQRGTLYGPPRPSPTCPRVDRAFRKTLGLPLDGPRATRQNVVAARGCYHRLVVAGVDLGAYNTTESAADVADLRRALGIHEWNVFGVSYGTNLAMTLMRQHPRGIRTVTLDSVEPPELITAASFAPIARAGFNNIFRACMAQPRCWPRQPGIGRTFTRLVRRLETHPVTTRVKSPTGGPLVKVVLDGGRLANWLIDESFSTAE